MLGLTFRRPVDRPLRVLCLGAHSDDIEIGCGGTVLRLLEENEGTEVRWVVFGASGERVGEANRSAGLFLSRASHRTVVVKGFPDGFFPQAFGDIKQYFEVLKSEWNPDIVLTHHEHDRHQDHRVVAELTWNTFRNHFILEYEIVKYDGDLGAPTFFVPLPEAICRRKVANILEAFATQRGKAWFTEDTFMAMLRIRGVECNAADKYAEAFYCRKACY